MLGRRVTSSCVKSPRHADEHATVTCPCQAFTNTELYNAALVPSTLDAAAKTLPQGIRTLEGADLSRTCVRDRLTLRARAILVATRCRPDFSLWTAAVAADV